MNRISFGAKALTLAAFFSTMPIYSPNIALLQQYLNDDGAMGLFVMPLLASSALASAGIFLCAAKNTGRLKKPFALCSSIVPFLYSACMAGFVLIACRMILGLSPLIFMFGAAIGFCFPFLTIQWGKQLSSLDLRQALLLICATCGTAAAINWAFGFLRFEALAAAFIAMTVIGSFSPSVLPKLSIFRHDEKDEAAESKEAMDCEKDERRASLLIPRFASVLVPALVGLSVFAFHMGVSRALVLDSISTETIGNIIASLALAPLCFVKSKRPVSVLLFSGAAPIVATALLACMGIANDINLGDGVVSTGIYTFFCMIAQISLALGIAGTHAREFTASMIWSGFLALFSAFSILGISLGGFLSNEQPFMPQAITALYCAYLVVQSVRSLWKNDSTSCSDGSKTNDEREGFSSRCEKLASEFSLSPRETEIVAYLGRGHTCSYIAKTLVISESTVYTHARNIYRKIGIGSKEDLVQILTK